MNCTTQWGLTTSSCYLEFLLIILYSYHLYHFSLHPIHRLTIRIIHWCENAHNYKTVTDLASCTLRSAFVPLYLLHTRHFSFAKLRFEQVSFYPSEWLVSTLNIQNRRLSALPTYCFLKVKHGKRLYVKSRQRLLGGIISSVIHFH